MPRVESQPTTIHSVLDMLRFYGDMFVLVAEFLGRSHQNVEHYRLSPQLDEELDDSDRAEKGDFIATCKRECTAMNLTSATDQIGRMEAALKGSCTYRHWSALEQELQNRIFDELSHLLLFAIPREQDKYYEQKGSLFGDAVAGAFPSAVTDIEEAGKCYATDRSTACVFHLMRVAEWGLRSLAKALNEPRLNPKTNPTWETILRRCDEELQKSFQDRSPEWLNKDHFFSEATSNLRALKNAWRNPTMHVDKAYDQEKALDIMNAVGAFMRHLATELKETP